MKAKKTADAALQLLMTYGVHLVLGRKGVAIEAAREAGSGLVPSAGQPTNGLSRVDAQGQEGLAKLSHDLDGQLGPIEEDLAHRRKEIETQGEVVEVRKKAKDEKVKQQRKTQAEVEAVAAAKGKPFLGLGLRKLSTRKYIILLAVFGAADVILNATALVVIGEGNVWVWCLAIALVAALLWVSHVAGTEMREAEEDPDDLREQRQRRWALIGAATIVVFLVAIGYIRAKFLQAQGVDGQLLAVYALQLIVAVAAIAAAYYHASSYADALKQAEAEVQQAQEALEAEEESLSQLQGEQEAQQIEKVYVVLGYLRAGEALVRLTDELKFLYVTVYCQTLQAAGQAAVEFIVPPTPIPEWMWEWATWLNEQTIVDRPSVGIAWRRELSPPAS
jgi:hypothetical protein